MIKFMKRKPGYFLIFLRGKSFNIGGGAISSISGKHFSFVKKPPFFSNLKLFFKNSIIYKKEKYLN